MPSSCGLYIPGPQGPKGDPGVDGLPGPPAPLASTNPVALAIAPDPGASSAASRADHAHPRQVFPTYTAALIPGTVTLGTKELTLIVNGLQANDPVVVQPSSALPAGLSIGHWRVPSANTLVVQVCTAIAVGLTLGSSSFSLLVTVLK